MFVFMISRSSSKPGHVGSKTRSHGQISGKSYHSSGHIFQAIIMTCSKCLSLWFFGQVWNWVSWGQKLGHQAKPAENFVNTLAVTFLKQSSWILLKMFVLMISRSSLKLGHLGQKPGHLAKSAENLVNTLAVTFLKQSWILLKMFVLMISRSSS